jgi:hypothetical protein
MPIEQGRKYGNPILVRHNAENTAGNAALGWDSHFVGPAVRTAIAVGIRAGKVKGLGELISGEILELVRAIHQSSDFHPSVIGGRVNNSIFWDATGRIFIALLFIVRFTR